MKKKIFLCAIYSVALLSFGNSILAAPLNGGSNTDGTCTATLHLNKLSGTSSINASGIDHNNHSYYMSTVDGHKSMCMNAGAPANSNTKYSRGETITGFAAQAYQYFSNNNGELEYLVAQTAMWSYLNNNDYETIINGIADVYTRYSDNSGVAYNDIAARAQAIATYNTISSTSVSGTYYMWYSENIGEQAMISGLAECDPPQSATCPGGEMITTGSIGECNNKVGGETYTFQYLAISGSNDSVHQKYGEVTNASGTGAYCRLFCQEQADVTLPGLTTGTFQIGSYIVWPTSQSNSNSKFYANLYPLKFKGVKSCKLVLMPDDGNFPYAGVSTVLGNGGCNIDPVEEYNNRYQQMYQLGNTGDYAGVRYENVRIYNGKYDNEPEVCGILLDEGEVSKSSLSCGAIKYTVPATNQYYNSGYRYSYYEQKINEINIKADAWESAYQAWKPYEQYKDQKEPYPCPSGAVINGVVQMTTCQRLTANAETEKSLRSQKDSAANNYNSAVATFRNSSFQRSISKCREYIELFNFEREILHELSLCGNYDGNETNYNFESSASFSYNDKEYHLNNALSQENATSYSCVGSCAGLNMKEKEELKLLSDLYTPAVLAGYVSQIENRDFQIQTNEINYTMTSNYKYINKKKNKYTTTGGGANYVQLGVRVVPTSYNNPILDSLGNALKYQLKLFNLAFGENRKFGSDSEYVCEFDLTKDIIEQYYYCPQDSDYPNKELTMYIKNGMSYDQAVAKYCYTTNNDECLCPPGTEKEGYDLSSYLGTMTCGEAQRTKCGGTKVDPPRCPKPNDDKLLEPCLNGSYDGQEHDTEWCYEYYCKGSCSCPEDSDIDKIGMDLSLHLDKMSCSEAQNKYCYSSVIEDKYRCKNTNGIRTGMDITSCVLEVQAKGSTLQEAIDYCDAVICPLGKFVIYRTIKLENPFPGKNISGIISGFNNDVIGRYPGANWDGKLLVYNKIRNNRSGHIITDESQITNNGIGSDIYDKEPLYRFILTSATISKIREYNDDIGEGYSDYNLECKRENSACVSSFVHSDLSGLSDTVGTCRNSTTKDSFYICSKN